MACLNINKNLIIVLVIILSSENYSTTGGPCITRS
uniref:Uncharacterized protein n=1 Tax=Lepeophtheirus salmonis TaxID=72036 RepID=A0A0K2VJA8_LEPSM